MTRITLDSKTALETKHIPFDFASLLPSGVTLSTAATTASVYRGVDASPSSLISGSASVSGTVASQTITAGVLGVIYNLICTGTLSNSDTVTLSGLLAVTDTQT